VDYIVICFWIADFYVIIGMKLNLVVMFCRFLCFAEFFS
jgi:hypothetical protein